MPLILAIEPDGRQAAILKRVVRDHVRVEMIVVASKDDAVTAITKGVPDLILLTLLISPRDEEELIGHLRRLERADHLQTLTIPLLSSARVDAEEEEQGGGLLRAFRKRKRRSAARPRGCDPEQFAGEIREYLRRAEEIKSERQAVEELSARRLATPPVEVGKHRTPGMSGPPVAETAGAAYAEDDPWSWRSSYMRRDRGRIEPPPALPPPPAVDSRPAPEAPLTADLPDAAPLVVADSLPTDEAPAAQTLLETEAVPDETPLVPEPTLAAEPELDAELLIAEPPAVAETSAVVEAPVAIEAPAVSEASFVVEPILAAEPTPETVQPFEEPPVSTPDGVDATPVVIDVTTLPPFALDAPAATTRHLDASPSEVQAWVRERAIPFDVALVAYPRGCRLHRIRVSDGPARDRLLARRARPATGQSRLASHLRG